MVINRKSVNEHYHTLKAINEGKYRDVSKELVALMFENNKKLDNLNARLINLENIENRHKISVSGDVRFDSNGLANIEYKRKHIRERIGC